MEIPTAVIHRLQSSLREAASAPPSSAPPPPFPFPSPSVADAVAAFDRGSGSGSDASPELRCARCGAAGGLLRGARSAVCVYCGTPRPEEEGSGVAFRGCAAYWWLLGSLGLDGSELVEFDSEPTDSNKNKEAPKNGIVLSDLLDLKLSCPPENREASESSKSKEQPSAVYTLDLSGVNLDSFFVERIEETTAPALPRNHTVGQQKSIRDGRSHESSTSGMHATSKGFNSSAMKTSSQSTNQVEATASFANWDADFQSAGLESVVVETKQLDLFKTSPVSESFNFPASGTATTSVVATEDLASASVTSNKDNLFKQKVVQPIVEDNSGIITENSVDFSGSSLNKNSAESNQLPQRGGIGASIDEAFDVWQEFTGGGSQGTLSNVGEYIDGPLESDHSETKGVDSSPISSMKSSNNVAGDSSDDWQAFASMKPVEGSTSGEGGNLVKPVEETTSISFDHSSEVSSVNIWPEGNCKEHNTAEIVKQTDDSFDDWQDITTSGPTRGASLNQAGDMTDDSHVSHREIDVDSWFTGNTMEANNNLVNENNIMLDDWQGFTGSDQAQQSSSIGDGKATNISFEQHEGTGSVQAGANTNNKDGVNTVSTNIEDNTFDVWQNFTSSGHRQENLFNLGGEADISSDSAKEIDSMHLWLTSNIKESKSNKGVSRIDDSSDGWQNFASFGQALGSTEIPREGHSIKDPSGNESLDLWSLSHIKESKNIEQTNENNDPFDDWQGFKNSCPVETSLQAPSLSRPDTHAGLEFGSFAQSVPSGHQKDIKKTCSEANVVPSVEHLERSNEMQQMGDVDVLSTMWAATSPDNHSISKPEPVDARADKLLSQMHDLSFMLKDELSVPDKPVDHSKS